MPVHFLGYKVLGYKVLGYKVLGYKVAMPALTSATGVKTSVGDLRSRGWRSCFARRWIAVMWLSRPADWDRRWMM